MKITTIGINLTRTAFQLHAVDPDGMPVLCKKLERSKALEFFGALPPCRIGMVACGDANYWAHRFERMGHDVKLVGARCIKPHAKGDPADAAIAAAICDALANPATRFVPVKPEEQ